MAVGVYHRVVPGHHHQSLFNQQLARFWHVSRRVWLVHRLLVRFVHTRDVCAKMVRWKMCRRKR